MVLQTGIGFAERAPRDWAKNVQVPTFLYQVRDDVMTESSDVQAMFDNLASIGDEDLFGLTTSRVLERPRVIR